MEGRHTSGIRGSTPLNPSFIFLEAVNSLKGSDINLDNVREYTTRKYNVDVTRSISDLKLLTRSSELLVPILKPSSSRRKHAGRKQGFSRRTKTSGGKARRRPHPVTRNMKFYDEGSIQDTLQCEHESCKLNSDETGLQVVPYCRGVHETSSDCYRHLSSDRKIILPKTSGRKAKCPKNKIVTEYLGNKNEITNGVDDKCSAGREDSDGSARRGFFHTLQNMKSPVPKFWWFGRSQDSEVSEEAGTESNACPSMSDMFLEAVNSMKNTEVTLDKIRQYTMAKYNVDLTRYISDLKLLTRSSQLVVPVLEDEARQRTRIRKKCPRKRPYFGKSVSKVRKRARKENITQQIKVVDLSPKLKIPQNYIPKDSGATGDGKISEHRGTTSERIRFEGNVPTITTSQKSSKDRVANLNRGNGDISSHLASNIAQHTDKSSGIVAAVKEHAELNRNNWKQTDTKRNRTTRTDGTVGNKTKKSLPVKKQVKKQIPIVKRKGFEKRKIQTPILNVKKKFRKRGYGW